MTRSQQAHRRGARGLAAFFAALCLIPAAPSRAGDETPGAAHALLINGGSKPASNYQSHLHHLEDMVALLEARGLDRERIHVFSADGEEAAPDMAVRDALPPDFWLLEGTRLGKRLKPRTEVTDTRWAGVKLHPARKAALGVWFEAAHKELAPGDELLLFVTDHGNGNKDDPDNGTISLWQEKLSVRELADLLHRLQPGVRVVMVMSQCYSGTFADAMVDGRGPSGTSGDICGFFSTTRDLRAYGCYPEGRDRDRIGHAFQFIDALGRRATAAAAHLEVLVTDGTPDVPLRTSDVYLERLLAAEAAARGTELDALADRLLAEAWLDRAAWETQIRLLDRIGDAFGTFSPRSLAELETNGEGLPQLTEKMKTYAERWKTTLVAVKEENLAGLLAESPEWRERLQSAALKELDAEGREALLAELLPQVEWRARDRPEIWYRLEGLRDRAGRASEARWRLDVRRAATLRMRSILIGIAGRVLLLREPVPPQAGGIRAAERRALESLESCEASEPGMLPARLAARSPRVVPFPPLADELRLLEEVLPSWLGVGFKPVPKVLQAGRQLPAGASWLDAVYPESPAKEAGLEVGDLVLGPPERPFTVAGQIREWTMISPRHTPLPLLVVRPGESVEQDLEFEATLILRPYPLELPKLPGPPQVGDLAPALPPGLVPVGSGGSPDLVGRSHLLFYWATWCLPCKRALPEVMAFAEDRGLEVLAISDEDAETVTDFVEKQGDDFFRQVAVDPLRKSFLAYGVSGTPTLVMVDDKGIVRHRQAGYKPASGLTVKGWSWSESRGDEPASR